MFGFDMNELLSKARIWNFRLSMNIARTMVLTILTNPHGCRGSFHIQFYEIDPGYGQRLGYLKSV